MRIGLINVDSKLPNLALLKLSSWHKKQGHEVEIYTPIEAAINPFDTVYASKVFANTPDCPYLPEDVILGGTGYNDSVLPDEIEHICPDYSLYDMSYSVGFTSRGCIRKCPFCIVPAKEGGIKEHSSLSEFVRHKEVKLLDNNFLASPLWRDKLNEMIDRKLKVDFNQGLDIRLITDENAELLTRLNPPFLRFAWDFVELEGQVRKGLETLKKAGFPIDKRRVNMYLLTNYNTTPEQDLYRIETLKAMNVLPYVMVYEKHKAHRLMRELQNWANQPHILFKYTWPEYRVARKLPALEGGYVI